MLDDDSKLDRRFVQAVENISINAGIAAASLAMIAAALQPPVAKPVVGFRASFGIPVKQ
jgi:hypothetical protein